MRDELMEQARSAVQIALDVGADDAVAGVSRGRALEFRWRDGKLEKVQEDTSRGLGISLYVDGRYSGHSTNDLDPGRLRHFLTDAVALTRHLEPDPYRKITDPALYEGRQDIDLELVDPNLAELTRESRIEWCEVLSDTAREHGDVISASSGVMDSYGGSARASSNGFEGYREAASIWYGAEVSIRDGATKRPEAYRWVGGSHLDSLPGPQETGAEALQRVLVRRGAEKIPSLKSTMVVDPEAASPLIRRILGAMSAGAIQQKRSFLSESLGKSITSPLLSMTDDPFRKQALGSRLWDGEGIATRVRPLIEDGVLAMFFVATNPLMCCLMMVGFPVLRFFVRRAPAAQRPSVRAGLN